ncbi:MobF family relaxase, partial [Actinomycetota bacterium]
LRGGTATGWWRGSGAAELGLAGTVTAEGLVRLFDGQHPGTGEQLGRSLRRDGVAAWDVTFSADKSVSLLWALGDDETRSEVVAAFDEATSQALGYLESVASATRGASKTPVLDSNGDPLLTEDGRPRFRVETWPIATTGYVAASFTEYTSRADDPQLHTHVVVANKVKGVDGKWRTVDGRLLFRYQLAAGYLHEAVLRHELTQRLGVRWQPVRNGMADIAGFTRAQIEAFSTRRRQLEEWRQDQGLADSAAARQVAVLATRTPKTDQPLEALEGEWRRRAAEVGLTPEWLTRLMSADRRVTSVDSASLFEHLASPDGLTERVSTFELPDVIKEIAAALPRGGTRDDIESLAEAFLYDGRVVSLLGLPTTGVIDDSDVLADAARNRVSDRGIEEDAGMMRRRDGSLFPGARQERRYSTTELLETERRIIEHAIAGIGGGRWSAPSRLVEARLRPQRHLTDEQADMVRHFAASGNAIDIGIGPAGTGKTNVMARIRELAVLTGSPILGGALAGRTAAGLQAATGIPSTTLARLIADSRDGGGLPSGAIMVVDEAGMVGTRQLAAVADLVEAASGKLILIGDDRQLPEIGAGGLFRALATRLPVAELTTNVRQRQQWERDALVDLRNGSVDQAIETYRQRGRLIIGEARNDTMDRAVADWYRHVVLAGDVTAGLLISYDNDTVTELNHRARIHFASSGQLTGPTVDVGERSYAAGDRILCRRNQSRLGVLNGDLGTVVAVDQVRTCLTVRLDRDSEIRNLPAWYVEQGHIDYGYAMTGHKAQGVTTGRTFVVVDGTTDREWTYVAMSRGREDNTLYLAGAEPPEESCAHLTHADSDDALNRFTAALNRRSAHTAAIDHAGSTTTHARDPLGPPPPSSDIAARVAWIAERRTERDAAERQSPGIDRAVGG